MDRHITRMKELNEILSRAGKAYYQESREIMSNYEYDKLYDELLELEEKTGIILSSSPTQTVGYQVLSQLPKEAHETPMLSLDKTKSREDLRGWLGDQIGILSWKLDGLTIVLTYNHGKLQKAVTRGNGEIGEVITSNAKVFSNIPLHINFKNELVLRGEAIITYSEFRKINAEINEVEAKYKNPRNLCSGSVRQLNNEITAKRNVRFKAFGMVKADGVDFENSRKEQFDWMKRMGFEIVEYHMVTGENLFETIDYFAEEAEKSDDPSDGLVLLYDDISYGEGLGSTSKFPRNAIAYKWQDEVKETTLKRIQWSASRTGLINPVAIFEPVELEGTTVSRASVHNISIMEGLELGEGDCITVYKANMIIPQIADNLTRSNSIEIPKECPVCGGHTQIKTAIDVKSLYCMNPDCQAKQLKSFAHLVSRDALNIDGLSQATLEKFIASGFMKEFADIFHLERYQEQIVELEGFGEKSYDNLIKAIKESSHTTLPRLVYGLGITGIGLANAKMLCKVFHNNFVEMRNAHREALMEVEGIGGVLADGWVTYFSDGKNREIVDHLLDELNIQMEETEWSEAVLQGMTFVITGSVEQFSNRKELQKVVEARGGKVTASVTSKTDYLINNQRDSTSSKNKKAIELGIPILSEDDFLNMIH